MLATPQLSPACRKIDNEHSGNFSACNNTKITEHCKEETDSATVKMLDLKGKKGQ